MPIGVLALQGDFDAHRRRLEELGAKVVLIKKPEQLDAIDGLVIPGGESGTFLKLLGEEGFEKLKQFVRLKPTFGTCAGAILLATEVENPKQAGLGAIDIRIRRNAYGRQLDSSIREGQLLQSSLNADPGSPLEMVFIRAPKIEQLGAQVEVIATEGKDKLPVAVRQGSAMAAPCWSSRAAFWPPPSTPNSPRTPASTRHFWICAELRRVWGSCPCLQPEHSPDLGIEPMGLSSLARTAGWS